MIHRRPLSLAAYNAGMRGWSIGIGKIFGVELRLGSFFLIILPVLVSYSLLLGSTAGRGIVLWLLLVFAVAVHEVGRAIATSYFSRSPERLVLLPTGAVPAESGTGATAQRGDRTIALAGPIANFLVGVTMAMLMYAVTAEINLFERPWVTPARLLRSAIWAQILLGGLNLLPAFPLDAGFLLRRQFVAIRGAVKGARAAAGVSQATGWLLILAGAGLQNVWMMLMGGSVLLTAQVELQSTVAQEAASSVTMADVMLHGFTTLAASDTLEDALGQCVHSLQDAFPVLRGQLLVGTVTRSAIADALRTGGNGYVQSVMSRRLAICAGADPLVTTLRQAPVSADTRLIAVVEDERVIGIVTPQTLGQSMALLGQTRRLRRRNERGTDAERNGRSGQ